MKILDIDIKELSNAEILDIGKMVVEELVVVIPQQSLTPQEEVDFCSVIGTCEPMLGERTKHIAIHNNILRVTGEKNEHGEEGLFGHTSTLNWHADQASNINRSPLIWLYADKGSTGSVTSWIDTKQAYEDLSQEFKDEIKDVELTLGYRTGSYSSSEFFYEHHNTDHPFRLVHTNDAGHKGLYFPFLQIFSMVGKSPDEFESLMAKLQAHVLDDKYRYDHHWKDGDVVISEQWLTMHKRHEFDKMEDRVLHRIAFNYSNITLSE